MFRKAIRTLIPAFVFAGAISACTTLPRVPEPPTRAVCAQALNKMRGGGIVVAAGGTHFGLLAAVNFVAGAAPGVNAYYFTAGLLLNIAGELEMSENKAVWQRQACDSAG